MDAAHVVGKLVTREFQTKPRRARYLLEAAYSYVNVAGRLASKKEGVSSAVSRFNGTVARDMVRSLRHPERSAIVNVFLPCELLHALDITPMFPEGMSVYVACTRCPEAFCEAAENSGIPESFCSYHKLMLGLSKTNVLPAPALVVNTTFACDANQVSFRSLAQRAAVPHLVIDVPQTLDEEAVDYVAAQLHDLQAALEECFGRRLNQKKLRVVCERSQRTLSAIAEFARRRHEVSLPMSLTGELCVLIASHIMLGTPEAERFSWNLLKSLHGAPPSALGDRPRIFWIHTLPNWQEVMGRVFDNASGAELVGNDIAYDALSTLDALDPSQPFDFMARRLVANAANGTSERRIEAALAEAQAAGAHGIVIFGHWGCKQTQGLAQLGRRRFEAAGFPTLVLDGDGCDPRNVSDGQMVTRVRAFLEQLSHEDLRVA